VAVLSKLEPAGWAGQCKLALDSRARHKSIKNPATIRSRLQAADFVFLQRATGLTKGNLSSHLTKLEEAGLLKIEKRFVNKKPNTNVELTPVGKQRIMNHWSQLDRLKNLSKAPAEAQR
jgi:DNA-binding MarR family transcriptional regulator